MKQIRIYCLAFIPFLLTRQGFSQDYHSENLFYMGESSESYQSFLQHADQISIICPATFSIDSVGVITGGVDHRVLETATEYGVKVMPLFAYFNQQGIHELLMDRAARLEAIRLMLFYAHIYHFYGWQMDLENVNFRDKAHYTYFFRQAADSLHAHGLIISMAIVKSDQPAPDAGNYSFQRYMYENWTGAFDLTAIAKAADFISFMTYDQHMALTPPGPVAGMPWFKKDLNYLISLGIPREKISLGIPAYSDYWFPTGDPWMGARSTRDEISYSKALDLLGRYGATKLWMPNQKVYYARWEEGGIFNWLFMEDARSFMAKFDVARQQKLLGISVWLIGMEDPGIWSDLKTAHTVKIQ
ncbi:MAG TPA: glycosyl hydrolase family 18 protein [Chitinophagaceae bacterium]|nr:glycosyl hydrolase family 18 protein [Chitinophagaceae bacterium]